METLEATRFLPLLPRLGVDTERVLDWGLEEAVAQGAAAQIPQVVEQGRRARGSLGQAIKVAAAGLARREILMGLDMVETVLHQASQDRQSLGLEEERLNRGISVGTGAVEIKVLLELRTQEAAAVDGMGLHPLLAQVALV